MYRGIMPEPMISGWDEKMSPDGCRTYAKTFQVNFGDATVIIRTRHSDGPVLGSVMDVESRMDPSTSVRPSERDFLRKVLIDHAAMSENLASTQGRSTVLINKAREWRKRIIALGGEDPGEP